MREIEYKCLPYSAMPKEFDFSNYYEGEQNLIKPNLEKLGYTDIKFSMGEWDSFGPLSRIVTATDSNNNRCYFSYG